MDGQSYRTLIAEIISAVVVAKKKGRKSKTNQSFNTQKAKEHLTPPPSPSNRAQCRPSLFPRRFSLLFAPHPQPRPHLLPRLPRDAGTVQRGVAGRSVLGVNIHPFLLHQKFRHGLVAVLARKEECRAVVLLVYPRGWRREELRHETPVTVIGLLLFLAVRCRCFSHCCYRYLLMSAEPSFSTPVS